MAVAGLVRACAEALPSRDRPRPWMAEASVQGRIHSVSREGNASAQAESPLPDSG